MVFVMERECVFWEAEAEYLGALAILRKETISFVMYVRLSVRTEQLGSHWTDFHEI
jgi:hypothetical protein